MQALGGAKVAKRADICGPEKNTARVERKTLGGKGGRISPNPAGRTGGNVKPRRSDERKMPSKQA